MKKNIVIQTGIFIKEMSEAQKGNVIKQVIEIFWAFYIQYSLFKSKHGKVK